MMEFDKITRPWEVPARADKSAVGTMNRPRRRSRGIYQPSHATGNARRGRFIVPTADLSARAVFCLLLLLTLALAACNDQSQKPDPRLKYFTILDSRVLIADNNAEVFGEVENTSQMKFPFDVTMQANLMDNNGQSVGNATGTAEDVGPGQVRQFVLVGTVDGTRYAKMKVTAVSLQEKRQELGLPTPTPISP